MMQWNGRDHRSRQQGATLQLQPNANDHLLEARSRRSHSLNDYLWLNEGGNLGGPNNGNAGGGTSQVCLEQLVSMDHR